MMKIKNFADKIFFYSLYLVSAILIFFGWLSLFKEVDFINKLVLGVSIYAMLITALDFFKTVFDLRKNEISLLLKIIATVLFFLFNVIVFVSPYYLYKFLYDIKPDINTSNLSNYITFAALGIVFLTKAVTRRLNYNKRIKLRVK